MFEDKAELLRGHIGYLEEVLSEAPGNIDATEVEQRLADCRNDIDDARSSMPYDEVDDDEEHIEDFSGDNLEDGELEDEIVEIEALMERLGELMSQAVELIFDGDSEETLFQTNGAVTTEHQDFNRLLEQWLSEEIAAKCNRKGLAISDDEMKRKAKALYFGARHCGRFPEAAEAAAKECPGYGFTADELKQVDLFSPGLFHIAMELIQTHDTMGEAMDFKQWLSIKKSIWADMI